VRSIRAEPGHRQGLGYVIDYCNGNQTDIALPAGFRRSAANIRKLLPAIATALGVPIAAIASWDGAQTLVV
jgi:hypothetical protein